MVTDIRLNLAHRGTYRFPIASDSREGDWAWVPSEPSEIRKTIKAAPAARDGALGRQHDDGMAQRGEFPRRFALSPRCIVWDLAEVHAWLLARRAKPIHRAKHSDITKRKSRPVKGQDRARWAAWTASTLSRGSRHRDSASSV